LYKLWYLHTYKISFIGAGNVASHLAQDLFDAGHTIVQVFSRHKENASELASFVNAESINSLEAVNGKADVYIISVKDDAVAEIAATLPLTGKFILHTSASVPTVPPKKSNNHFGVLYPLQTFSKSIPVDLSKVPIFIDGEDAETKKTAGNIAASLTLHVYEADEKKRLALHVAAVFANNFTNHTLALAEAVMKKEGLNFDLLKPLVETTLEKVRSYSPSAVQTGPAARNDTTTIKKHEEYLEGDEHLLKIYKLLTTSIHELK